MIAKRTIARFRTRPAGSDGENRAKVLSRIVDSARRRVPAYRDLLAERKVDPRDIRSLDDFRRRVPFTDKEIVFGGKGFGGFCASGYRKTLKTLYTSSGFTRHFSFSALSFTDHARAAFFIEEILFRLCGIPERDLLVVNCLSLGTNVPQRKFPQARTGLRSDSVIEIIKRARGEFKAVAIACEPHFLKRVAEEGRDAGFSWKDIPVFAVTGSEYTGEYWRRYLSGLLGHDPQEPKDPRRGAIISTFGITEIGLAIFFETQDLIGLRGLLTDRADLREKICGEDVKSCPLLMHYFPGSYYLETVTGPEGARELCVTTLAADRLIPLVRYRTGDEVLLYPPDRFAGVLAANRITLSPRHFRGLPVGIIRGRGEKLLLPDGDWISPHEVKDALFMNPAVAGVVTGHFRLLQKKPGGEVRLVVQLGPGRSHGKRLAETIMENLSRVANVMLPVEVQAYRDFPYGFEHDFERKNRYVETGSAVF